MESIEEGPPHAEAIVVDNSNDGDTADSANSDAVLISRGPPAPGDTKAGRRQYSCKESGCSSVTFPTFKQLREGDIIFHVPTVPYLLPSVL